MKKKILYHLFRKSDYIYALTDGNLRYSQFLAVINDLKQRRIEFDEINCVIQMDEEFYEEIFESIRTLSSNIKGMKHYNTGSKFRTDLNSAILQKEKENEYNIETSTDGMKLVRKDFLKKQIIEKLIVNTQKFYGKKKEKNLSFIIIDDLDEVQAKLNKKITEDAINHDVYILNDFTGEIFKDFYIYTDKEIAGLNFILNKNEHEHNKLEYYNFKKNIFGTNKLPVNYLYKMWKSIHTVNKKKPFHKILTKDEKLIEKLEYTKFLAELDETILIIGDTGTGKELLAEGIHHESKRSDKLFVPVNCSAIPDSLFESEMFGYEEGAFTGADKKKEGHFESANGGTLFLDEIGDLPPTHQAKVLRVLQEKKFKRVGGNKDIDTDFRLICATNIDITKNEFRNDLLYRIGNITIKLPSLKERDKSDIELLVSHFVDSNKTKYQKFFSIEYSKKAIEYLSTYDWPGNVRQLNSFVSETFYWTAFKKIPKYDDRPIKGLAHGEPVYNTYESFYTNLPNSQDGEPLYEEKPIIIDYDFVKKHIDAQKIKDAKCNQLDSDIYSKIMDENIALSDLPQSFNINEILDDIKKNYIMKLIKAEMPQKEIANKFGVKQQTVSNWLKAYGIK